MNKENWKKFKDGELIIHFEEINDVRDFYEQSKICLPEEENLFSLLYTMYNNYGYNSCIRREYKKDYRDLLVYGDVSFYKNKYSHLPIITWKDFAKQPKTHNIEINGVVISEMDEEKFIDEFITWVESIGGSYLGITKEIEENN